MGICAMNENFRFMSGQVIKRNAKSLQNGKEGFFMLQEEFFFRSMKNLFMFFMTNGFMEGTSSGMEAKFAEMLSNCSTDWCNMRYKSMVSDGDSRTCLHIRNIKPHGSDIEIPKKNV
ncbi:hypothetical protein CDAR_469041 [Caerostris darwini]|uniref:Uncharacterized protein n=1 Tax=Caerostris darwini TaxID=1538125 RepID=A0AAV4VG29_9ARAC|nr:hypothetical protein CDAR_469041 [Caerostris darwini]